MIEPLMEKGEGYDLSLALLRAPALTMVQCPSKFCCSLEALSWKSWKNWTDCAEESTSWPLFCIGAEKFSVQSGEVWGPSSQGIDFCSWKNITRLKSLYDQNSSQSKYEGLPSDPALNKVLFGNRAEVSRKVSVTSDTLATSILRTEEL